MKRFFKQFGLLASAALMFSSCLKDTPVNDYNQIAPVVIIPNANWPKNTATAATSITKSTTPTTIVSVYARYSYEGYAPSDITVTFAKDEADIAAYNTKFGTSYIAVPDAAITVSSLKVTIKAGERDAIMPVTVNTSTLTVGQTYILPYKITDASGQNLGANYVTYLYTMSIK
jgi:hypothetical protein